MLNKKYCVYLIICPDGKLYVGLTSNFCERLSCHLRTFGKESRWNILHSCCSLAQARIWESIEIMERESWKPLVGHNKTLGGAGGETGAQSFLVDKVKAGELLLGKIEEEPRKKRIRKTYVKFSELHEHLLASYKFN